MFWFNFKISVVASAVSPANNTTWPKIRVQNSKIVRKKIAKSCQLVCSKQFWWVFKACVHVVLAGGGELCYDFKLLLGLGNLLCSIFEFCTLTFDHVVFFAGDTEKKFLKVHIERNVKVCLSEQDFPVGSCQFKESFALNFLEAHRYLH